MTKKKKALIAACVFVGILLVAGITAAAVSNYGTQSDPLVTLSYLENTVKPDILSKISSGSGASDSFTVLSVSKGQTVTCSVGAEIMPRIGSVASSGTLLIDSTDGTSITKAGTALTANHLYVVSVEGNGFTATSASKVLIRGTYTVK